jgi:hypothetical protein
MKLHIQRLVKSFGSQYVCWRLSTLKAFQRRRNKVLRTRPVQAILQLVLPPLDRLIHQLQQEVSDIAALRAGINWREKSERSAGYLKRIHQERQDQQYIMALEADSNGDPPRTDAAGKESIAHAFYQQLYTATTVPPERIDRYLAPIRFHAHLSTDDTHSLLEPITIDAISAQASRMSSISSPGADGFGYPYWSLILQHRMVHQLAVTVFNDALMEGIFPQSWQDIRVRLLPKKGALTSLKNWRPISLINCDAKIFTRLLTKRMAPILNRVITPYQAGFLPGRFIAEHGLVLQLIMEQAQLHQHQGTGLLLDQEKAYDRVHPLYLEKTMLALGFPRRLVKSLIQLFFNNLVQININGNFTNSISQQRGLRQGDPLSPLLFNIALEPFLRSLQQDPYFIGYRFVNAATPPICPPPSPIKCLAYADDVCVFLDSPSDFVRLHLHIQAYTSVSNAHFNDHKTEAFALNGKEQADWVALFTRHRIPTYHHRHSHTAFRYLGFSMSYTQAQRKQVCDRLLDTVSHQVKMYSQRQLSIKGRVTIMNSLILAKVWYLLRILVVPQAFFQKLRRLICDFVGGKKTPRLSYLQMCQPIVNGGLGILDPQSHQKTMQLRWIRHILDPDLSDSFLSTILLHHLSLFPAASYDPREVLLFRENRYGALGEGYRSANLWFSAYDAIPVPLDLSVSTPATLCALPLHRLLILPSEHWLHQSKRQRIHGGALFIYDDLQGSLRIKVPPELGRPRLLLRRLYKEIMNRSVDLQPWIWNLIGQRFDPLPPCSFAPSLTTWWSHPFWSGPVSLNYRLYQTPGSLPPHRHPYKMIKAFWTAPMLPNGRTTWYKVLSNTIPLQHILAKMHPQDPTCIHCHRHEDLAHFVYHCPAKRPIWEAVLAMYVPLYFLAPTCILDFLLYLRNPPARLPLKRTLTLFSVTLHTIWSHHWQYKIHGVPFQGHRIIRAIVNQVRSFPLD